MSTLFPELGKGAAAVPEHTGEAPGGGESGGEDGGDRDGSTLVPVSVKLGLAGQAWRGGERSLTLWRRLLGMDQLADDDGRLSLEQVEVSLIDGVTELRLQSRRLGRVLLRVMPCQRTATDPLGVMVGLGGPVPNEAVRRLLGYAGQRLGAAQHRTLVKIVERDPERTTVAGGGHGGGQAETLIRARWARSLVRTHAGEEAWRVFDAELEQQRNYNHRLVGPILVINHEDLECSFATPRIGGPVGCFFSYSLAHLEQDRTAATPDGPVTPGDAENPWGEVTTDLNEADVLGGGARRVAALLDRVAAAPTRPALVIVKTSCVPKVIGDDLDGVMRRFEADTGVPTLSLDNIADEDEDFLSTLLERLRWEPEFCAPEQLAGRVNLVGFPQNAAMARLTRMLAALGLTVNSQLVPEIRLENIRRYSWAELQVFLDSDLYRPTFRQLLGNVDIRSLYVTPPFGVAGTRRFLEAVADALERGDGLEQVWAAEWDPGRDEWEALRARARGHRLGFVLDARGAELLLNPSLGTGVPVLDCLQEMGFALEFLLHADVPEGLTLPGSVSRFAAPAELAGLLTASESAAFYSELTFDRRLSRAGKARFSVADFALGLDGALGTLERLIARCELPFYRRYGRLFGRPFHPVEEA